MSFHNDPPGNDNPHDTHHIDDNAQWLQDQNDAYNDYPSDQQQMVFPSTSYHAVPQHQNPPIMNPPPHWETPPKRMRSGHEEDESMAYPQGQSSSSSYDQGNYYGQHMYHQQPQQTNNYIGQYPYPTFQLQTPNVAGPSNAHTRSSDPRDNKQVRRQRKRWSVPAVGEFIPKWKPKNKNPSAEENAAGIKKTEKERPPLHYKTLCMLACLNAPNNEIKTRDIHHFIMHNWSFYRDCKRLKRNVQEALQADSFQSEPGADNKTIHRLSRPEEELIYDKAELRYIRETDVRGEEFYERLKNGRVGLPRQVFYHVIDTYAKQYAGPENSALFYHMLSVGVIPQSFDPRFKVFENDTYPNEPEFQEERYPFERESVPINLLPGFGVNMKKDQRATEQMVQLFYNNISNYFDEQNNLKGKNDENWQTPKLDDF